MISPRAPEIGLPTLRLSSWASSSVWSLISAASLASARPRLPAAQVAQPLRSSNARRAASTARSTSAGPPCGAVAMTLPVAGLTTSNVWPSAASTGSPPMIIRAAVGALGSAVGVVISGLSDGSDGLRIGAGMIRRAMPEPVGRLSMDPRAGGCGPACGRRRTAISRRGPRRPRRRAAARPRRSRRR